MKDDKQPSINDDAAPVAESVFTYKTNAKLAVSIVGVYLTFALIFGSKGRYAAIAVVVAGAFGLPLPILELRRKIVVSPVGFEYKWRSGKVLRMAWVDIADVEETTTVYAISMRPIKVRAVRIIPRSGEAIILPLDFPKWPEILSRFRGMVSSNKAGTGA